jgi:hypothetical protein
MGLLVAVALGAAGLGFAVFAYAVPYRKAARDLKMARGELLAARAEASGRERELTLLRGDLSNAQQAAGDAVANVRSQTNMLRLALQEQSKSAPTGSVELVLEARGLQVRLADDYLFESGGAALSETGMTVLKSLGKSIGKNASRVIITAPMGKSKVPPELAASFPTVEELGAERVRVVQKALSQTPVPTEVLWGVSTGGPHGEKDASVDLEITPIN